ncbi:MAG: hypothetical protein ACSLEN_01935 [Candidatus Malihini olakiniferum]
MDPTQQASASVFKFSSGNLRRLTPLRPHYHTSPNNARFGNLRRNRPINGRNVIIRMLTRRLPGSAF